MIKLLIDDSIGWVFINLSNYLMRQSGKVPASNTVFRKLSLSLSLSPGFVYAGMQQTEKWEQGNQMY